MAAKDRRLESMQRQMVEADERVDRAEQQLREKTAALHAELTAAQEEHFATGGRAGVATTRGAVAQVLICR